MEHPGSRKKIASARHFLRCVVVEHRAAIEELKASTRELDSVLDGILSYRGDLRIPVQSEASGSLPGGEDRPLGAVAGLSVAQLKREADESLKAAREVIGASLRLRRRSQEVRSALRQAPSKSQDAAAAPTLSRREREVLTLIVAGKTSKEIAAKLGISFKTAVTHRTSIMSKLDVHQIASVVREAIRRGLV